jgi:hypothetical protein
MLFFSRTIFKQYTFLRKLLYLQRLLSFVVFQYYHHIPYTNSIHIYDACYIRIREGAFGGELGEGEELKVVLNRAEWSSATVR